MRDVRKKGDVWGGDGLSDRLTRISLSGDTSWRGPEGGPVQQENPFQVEFPRADRRHGQHWRDEEILSQFPQGRVGELYWPVGAAEGRRERSR